VAPSFGDIFASNAAKNGLLTVTLSDEEVAALRGRLHAKIGASLTIDLPAQTVTDPDGQAIAFSIDPFKKRCLVEGLDDVALTLEHADAITAFDAMVARDEPWRIPANPAA
jgi:3-isopropylmalate/(R)-2-methylmalate dehydratase small subunit